MKKHMIITAALLMGYSALSAKNMVIHSFAEERWIPVESVDSVQFTEYSSNDSHGLWICEYRQDSLGVINYVTGDNYAKSHIKQIDLTNGKEYRYWRPEGKSIGMEMKESLIAGNMITPGDTLRCGEGNDTIVYSRYSGEFPPSSWGYDEINEAGAKGIRVYSNGSSIDLATPLIDSITFTESEYDPLDGEWYATEYIDNGSTYHENAKWNYINVLFLRFDTEAGILEDSYYHPDSTSYYNEVSLYTSSGDTIYYGAPESSSLDHFTYTLSNNNNTLTIVEPVDGLTVVYKRFRYTFPPKEWGYTE